MVCRDYLSRVYRKDEGKPNSKLRIDSRYRFKDPESELVPHNFNFRGSMPDEGFVKRLRVIMEKEGMFKPKK